MNAGRQSDAQDAAHAVGVDAQRPGLHPDVQVRAHQPPQQDDGAEHIGQHRSRGHALYRHVEHRHEEQVHQHIQNTRDYQGLQRHFCVPHAAEDGRLEIIQQNGGHAQQIDAQIAQGEGQHVLRHAQCPQQGPGRQLAQQRNQNAPDDGHEHRRVYRAADGVPVPLANSVGDDYIGAQGDAHKQVDDQADHRAVGPHRRHGDGAELSRKIAHHRQVRGVEQLLQNGRGRHGQGVSGQFVPDGAAQHIQRLLLLRCFHSMSFLKRQILSCFLFCAGYYNAPPMPWQGAKKIPARTAPAVRAEE